MPVTTVISPNIFSIKTLIFYLQLQFCKSEKESENRQFIDLKVQLLSYINQSQRIELNSESTKIITTQEKLCFTMKPCWLVKLDWCACFVTSLAAERLEQKREAGATLQPQAPPNSHRHPTLNIGASLVCLAWQQPGSTIINGNAARRRRVFHH